MTAISLPPQCWVRERRKTVITSGLRHSPEVTRLCSPKMTHLFRQNEALWLGARRCCARLTESAPHASGVDNTARVPLAHRYRWLREHNARRAAGGIGER